MVNVVLKRDGRCVPFQKEKIVTAIKKSMEASGQMDVEIAERIATKIQGREEGRLEVEEIQDMVEMELMKSKCKNAAKEYIKYREARSQERERNSELNKAIRQVVLGENVTNANANVDEVSFSGKKNESANILHKDMALNDFIRPEVSQAVKENRIYIHDLSDYNIGSHNCLFADVDRLLSHGFCTRNGDVRKANSFSTACQLLAVIFQCQSQVRRCASFLR